MLNTLKELCLLNGVSGDEDEVRRYMVERIKSHASYFHADTIGNLIAFKKGKKSTGNRLMLCAHMDEVGVIVTRSQELNDVFREVTDRSGKPLMAKYGASTTWMGSLARIWAPR